MSKPLYVRTQHFADEATPWQQAYRPASRSEIIEALAVDTEALSDLLYDMAVHSGRLQERWGLPEEHGDGFWDAYVAKVAETALGLAAEKARPE